MNEQEARHIVVVGVMPGEIDSIDLARANGFLSGLEFERARASVLVEISKKIRRFLDDIDQTQTHGYINGLKRTFDEALKSYQEKS